MVNFGVFAHLNRKQNVKSKGSFEFGYDVTKKLTKEESQKASDEGRCYLCGEPEGDELSICNECRWN